MKEKQFVDLCSQQVVRLCAILIAYGLDDKGKENEHPHPIGPTKTGGIKFWKRSKQSAAKKHQGGKGQFPLPAKGINYQGFFPVIFCHLPEEGLSTLDKGKKKKERSYYRAEDPPNLLQCHNIQRPDHITHPPVLF